MARFSFVTSTRAKAQHKIKHSGPFLRRDLAHFYSAIDTTIFVLSVAAVIVVFMVLHHFLLPRIKVTADREGITVGRYKFDWEHSEGLRLGYSAGGKERENKQLGYVGLRMSYGAWGFDLPYMVNGYYSAAYVVWVNMMLETIGKHPDEMTNDPQAGFMKDLF